MTRRQIEKALPFWKGLLRLEDWQIEVRIELAKDMAGTWGLTSIHSEEMQALIQLRRGSNEETLVHELLHIVFDGDYEVPASTVGNYDCLFERALNRTAAALVKLAGTLPRSGRLGIPGSGLVTDEVNTTG